MRWSDPREGPRELSIAPALVGVIIIWNTDCIISGMKTVVVTGSSYGLGQEICRQLIDVGCRVVGLSRSPGSIDNPNFSWIKTDLTDPEDIKKLRGKIVDRVDVLINNAGTTVEKKSLDFCNEDFDKIFGLNFVAPIKMASLLFGNNKSGLIVNISSNSDRWPDPLWAMYGSTKAALNLYFDTVAVEYPKVKVVSLLPSFINTPLLDNLYIEEGFSRETRCIQASQVARLVSKVVSNPNDYPTGSRIIVVNSKQVGVSDNPENLYIYNVDNETLVPIRWKVAKRRQL